MRRPERTVLAGLFALALAGCALAPPYQPPAVPVAAAYQGPWQPAQPADQLPREGWWRLYAEPELDRLQQELLRGNTDLAAAYAHYRQAAAYTAQARAGLFPQISLGADAERNRQSDTKPLRGATSPSYYDAYTVDAQLDYEIDVWGRVRAAVEAGRDEELASAADLAAVRLSLQATLADDYLQLRGLDQQLDLLRQSTDAYAKALELTRSRHQGGIASGLDVARAQTQLDAVRSQLAQVEAQRALMQHAIAVLVGQSPSRFSLAAATRAPAPPAIPPAVPSTLLERRPDIAAAERRVAAANARIGVARAAYFPSLSLSAVGGWQSDRWGDLVSAPNRFWAIGPGLVFDLFDGGRRKAEVAAAKAATDEAAARYRGVVLAAFAQVEDELSLLDRLGSASAQQHAAAEAAQHALDLAMDRYRAGAVGYLDVVQAQTAALDAKRSALDLDTRRLSASVRLVRALGGGWQAGPDYGRAVADGAAAGAR